MISRAAERIKALSAGVIGLVLMLGVVLPTHR